MAADRLREKVLRLAREAGAEAVAAAYHDWETRTEWSLNGDTWFHAASTIKLPVLVGIYGVIAEGELSTDSRVHVRNRFRSRADGEPFRVEAARDANSEVQAAIGRTMKVEDLARHMIVTSSNLATNLLLDLVGVEEIQAKLQALNLSGIQLERGVEDERAFERGINNRVTAKGLLDVLRVLEERRAFSEELSERMLEILHGQEFNAGIPAGLPAGARVAHKTGEISTIAHDAGLVYLEGRKPYAVVILTRWAPEVTGSRQDTIARISRAVYQHLCTEDADA